jgi:hypothetical protein
MKTSKQAWRNQTFLELFNEEVPIKILKKKKEEMSLHYVYTVELGYNIIKGTLTTVSL